jgi:hypothetical protein
MQILAPKENMLHTIALLAMTVALSVCLVSVVRAQSDAPQELEKLVIKLAEDLDSDRKAVRDAAEAKLTEMGPSIVEHLPAVNASSSDEFKMRIDRIRTTLEQAEFKELTQPSTVSLTGKMSGREAINRLASTTGNAISVEGAENLDRDIIAEFEDTPFWEAFDEILDQLELTLVSGDGEKIRLMPRAKETPLRIAAAAYADVFRVEPLEVQKTLSLHSPSRNAAQIHLLLSWEPRINPVFVRFPLEAMKITCDDGQVIQPKAEEQENEFVPAGGSQLQVGLNFELPGRQAKKISKWAGEFFVSIPGKLAKLEFTDLMKASKQRVSVGNLVVILDKARKNRDIYEVLVRVSLSSGERSSDSFRGWSNVNEAYLLNAENKRVEHVGWSTTSMTENEIGLSYLFDMEKGLDGCKFVFRAPATLAEQTVKFVIEDVPLP